MEKYVASMNVHSCVRGYRNAECHFALVHTFHTELVNPNVSTEKSAYACETDRFQQYFSLLTVKY